MPRSQRRSVACGVCSGLDTNSTFSALVRAVRRSSAAGLRGGQRSKWFPGAPGRLASISKSQSARLELDAVTNSQAAPRSQPDQIWYLLQLIQPPKRELLERTQLAESPRQRTCRCFQSSNCPTQSVLPRHQAVPPARPAARA